MLVSHTPYSIPTTSIVVPCTAHNAERFSLQSAGQLKLQIAKDERVQEIILGPKKDARRIKELRKGTCHIYIQGIGF